jgi:uncharacterized protein YjbJ (UPF0337 family)
MSAKTQQWKGRIKQTIGTLSGNNKLEREGRTDRRAGEVKDQFARAQDTVHDAVDKAVDKATDAVKGTLGTGKTPRT